MQATRHLDAVQFLLDHGADVNAVEHTSMTALFAAVLSGNLPIVKLLLAHGADTHVRNKSGKLPISYAWEKAEYEIIQFCILLNHNLTLR